MKKHLPIYIAGPMTGHAQYNFAAFDASAESLRASGWMRVVSPAEISRVRGFDPRTDPIVPWPLLEIIKRDVRALLGCSSIVMLPGWQASHGARAEHAIAEWAGMDVYVYPSMSLICRETGEKKEGC